MISNSDSTERVFISIIMPCFNGEQYLDESIRSVVAQTRQDWELLVIDDGSTDNSRGIAAKWALVDPRVKSLVNDSNVGVSRTRNKGIELAKGEWIAFLDCDDVWEKDKLEKQILCADSTNSCFIFTGCSIISDNGRKVGEMLFVPVKVDYSALRRWNMITCSSVLVNRKSLGDLRFERDETREDYFLWLRYAKTGRQLSGISDTLVRYRIAEGSRSSNKIKMIRDTYRVHRQLGTTRIFSAYLVLSHFVNAYYHKYSKLTTKRRRDY